MKKMRQSGTFRSKVIKTTLGAASALGLLVSMPYNAFAQSQEEDCGLTLVKIVQGGTAQISDFTLTATNSNNVSVNWLSGQTKVVAADTYTLSESGPEGYDASEWECEDALGNPFPVVDGDTVTIGITDLHVTCTITNTFVPPPPVCPHLIVDKEVITDNGGTAVAADFTLTADWSDNPDEFGFNWSFQGEGSIDTSDTQPSIPLGTWRICETQLSGYSLTGFSCTGPATVSLVAGLPLCRDVDITGDAEVHCTFTNDDQAAPTTITKEIVGETDLVYTDFSYSLDGGVTCTPFPSDGSVDLELDAGPYAITECNTPAGFIVTLSAGCSGVAENGVAISCTITNTSTIPTIVKTADNATVMAGEEVGFTITITQGGASGSLCVQDLLPFGTGLDWQLEDNFGGACRIEPVVFGVGQVLNCFFEDVAAGESITIHVTATTPTDEEDGICLCVLENTAFLVEQCVDFLPLQSNAEAISDDATIVILCEENEAPVCGNGLHEAGEQCDNGELNGTEGNDCDAECKVVCPEDEEAVCGDNVREGTEECDDGNTVDGDGCSAICETEEGELEGCTWSQGYWKTHEEEWDDVSLELGNVTYDADALDDLFDTAPAGDASLILAHQLIAALLNIENGASTTAEVDQAIEDAQTLLAMYGGDLPYEVDENSDDGEEMKDLAEILESFNEGEIGPGHCPEEEEEEGPSAVSSNNQAAANPAQAATYTPSESGASSDDASAGLAATGSGAEPSALSGGCSSTGTGRGVGDMPALALLLLSLVAFRFGRSKAKKVN